MKLLHTLAAAGSLFTANSALAHGTHIETENPITHLAVHAWPALVFVPLAIWMIRYIKAR